MSSEEPPDDDPSPSGPPLPPEDRLWRHPSELGAFGVDRTDAPQPGSGAPAAASFVGTTAPRSPGRGRGTLAIIALASCLVGAVVALAGNAFLHTEDDNDSSDHAPRAAAVPTTVSLTTATTTGAAGDVAPAVARIVARIGDRWISGAGTLVDGKGSLITATSLVVGASQLLVTFDDGRIRKATMVGTDQQSGLALLHVDPTGVEPVRLSTADPTVGDTVALVAGPGDDGRTTPLVVGHVEAVGNQVQTTTGVLDDMVEIDKEVLPDHDGAGVADAEGELIGVGVAGDPSDGRGDVVPAAVVARVTNDLRTEAAKPHAWLGIEAVDLARSEATLLHVDGGARLTDVVDDSPAAKAGLATGDVVVALDGRRIGSTSAVVSTLATFRPDERITVRVLRTGKPLDVTATLGTKPPG